MWLQHLPVHYKTQESVSYRNSTEHCSVGTPSPWVLNFTSSQCILPQVWNFFCFSFNLTFHLQDIQYGRVSSDIARLSISAAVHFDIRQYIHSISTFEVISLHWFGDTPTVFCTEGNQQMWRQPCLFQSNWWWVALWQMWGIGSRPRERSRQHSALCWRCIWMWG